MTRIHMDRSPEREDVTRKLYEAASNGDPSYFARYLSRRRGAVVIGTAPDEWRDEYCNG